MQYSHVANILIGVLERYCRMKHSLRSVNGLCRVVQRISVAERK